MQIVRAAFEKHITGKEVEPYEYSLIKKDGKKLDVIITTNLIQYGGDSAILGIVTDVTERKQAEDALRAREHELENKTREREEVTAALKVLLKKRRDSNRKLYQAGKNE